LQNAPLKPGFVIYFAVEAIINVAGCTPRMTDVFGPEPRLVVAPFAQAEENRPASRMQGIAHGGIGSVRLQPLGVAPVVFQVINTPLRISLRVLKFVAPAAGPAAAGFVADIRIDAELQSFGVDVISQRFYARRELLRIRLDEPLGI